MRKLLVSVCTFIFLTGIIVLFNSCSKEQGSKTESLPGINPTVNPIPYSTIVYLIKPTDKSWNVSYYNAAKSSMLELKDWYKQQLGGKTFILNPVIIDTLSGLHDASWYTSNNGDSLGYTGDAHAYYNIKYELKQILGAKYDTTTYRYFAFVQAGFPEQTLPGSLGVEGETTLDGLTGSSANSWKGSCAHALGHAYGLLDSNPTDDQAMMSTGRWKYPNCIIQSAEKDALNASSFFKAP
jgi:hypothetical protein